jgi:hypothetical protein
MVHIDKGLLGIGNKISLEDAGRMAHEILLVPFAGSRHRRDTSEENSDLSRKATNAARYQPAPVVLFVTSPESSA